MLILDRMFIKSRPKAIGLLLGATIVAGLVRLWSSLDPLWFDEVWSVWFADHMSRAADVFRFSYDNNHIINTLYLYFFGGGSWWPRYRLLSIVAGTATVFLLGLIGFRKGLREGYFTLIFAIFSVPLVMYSAEARGYALAIFCAVGAFFVFDDYVRQARWYSPYLFWVLNFLGIASHLTYLYVFVGFVLAVLYEYRYKLKRLWSERSKLLVWFFVPSIAVTVGTLYGAQVELGGGMFIPAGFLRVAAFMEPLTGVALSRQWVGVVEFFLWAILLVWVFRKSLYTRIEKAFFVFVAGVVPVVSFVSPLPFFGARYLALSVPFMYLIFADWLANVTRISKKHAMVACTVVMLLMGGQLVLLTRHLRYGREVYPDVLRYITVASSAGNVTLAGNNDFSTTLMTGFYGERLGISKTLKVVTLGEIRAGAKLPDWFVVRYFPSQPVPPATSTLRDEQYKLSAVFSSAGVVSGWDWYVYRRD